MTRYEQSVRRLIKHLHELSDDANALELHLPNGAFVDNLLSTIASDIEEMLYTVPTLEK